MLISVLLQLRFLVRADVTVVTFVAALFVAFLFVAVAALMLLMRFPICCH